MSITAEDIVRLFEKDARARKRLAELLVSEPDVRLAIINAILRDVATKEDVERLRAEFSSQISELRRDISGLGERIAKLEGAYTELAKRIDDLDKRIDALDRRMDYVAKISWMLTGSVIATLIANMILALIR
jgi:predicted nuclease with TOPRIM domain